jgi:hypothetical protein
MTRDEPQADQQVACPWPYDVLVRVKTGDEVGVMAATAYLWSVSVTQTMDVKEVAGP